MWVTRGISLINFGVASSALAFQVFVLYPWHHELDDQFKLLKYEHQRVLEQHKLLHQADKLPQLAKPQ